MRRVLIRPSFHDWCQNRLFEKGTSFNGNYREAFRLWRHKAEQLGYRLETWDLASLSDADVLWFLDLPSSRAEFERIRAMLKPECKLVLQILESPVLSLHAFHPRNQKDYDAVLRYDNPTNRPNNHFLYRLPNTLAGQEDRNIPFHQRRGLVIVNSNRVEGIWAKRQKGLAGIPAIGRMLSGWNCNFSMLREFCLQERYSYRRRLARAAEDGFQDFVDIYGRGWNGEPISWSPLFPNRPYICAHGKHDLDKHTLCSKYRFVAAIENYQGGRGYISEKIFDAFLSRSVPVYLGEDNISELVPENSFVDARRFSSPLELLRHLRSMTEGEWSRIFDSGQQFIKSEKARLFSNESFSEAATKTLVYVSEGGVVSHG